MTASVTARVSDASDRRNLRRAGTFQKRSRRGTVVPGDDAAGAVDATRPADPISRNPEEDEARRLRMSIRLTEKMLARASPRNPRVRTFWRSSPFRILLVAWG